MSDFIPWDCPPRTKIKLKILDVYLGAWFSIVAKRFNCALYFDGFCGPGRYLQGEDGSPTIALRHASNACANNPNFKPILLFNDLDPKTVEFLQTGIQKNLPHPNVDWHVTANEFSGYSQRIVDRLDRGWESPLFAFIDPFGIKDMPFKQVERLLATPSSECFINLMAGWANRFIGHPDVEVAKHVTNLLGGEHVEEVLASTDRIATIRSLYETKLKTRVPYVKTFQMRDEGNVRDNALIFCSQKPLGFRKMKEAMWTIDPIYGNSFSAHDQARGKAGQDLFDSVQPPQTQLLGRQIAEKLRKDGPVGYDDLALWVEQNTDFLRKHARSELLAARERGELIIRAENGSLFKGNQLPKQAQISLRNQNG